MQVQRGCLYDQDISIGGGHYHPRTFLTASLINPEGEQSESPQVVLWLLDPLFVFGFFSPSFLSLTRDTGDDPLSTTPSTAKTRSLPSTLSIRLVITQQLLPLWSTDG